MRVARMLLVMFVLGLAVIAPSARADTIDVFTLNFTLKGNSGLTPVSGNITIDVSTGMITAASIDYLGQDYDTILLQGAYTGNTPPNETPIPFAYGFHIGTSAANLPQFSLLAQGPVAIDSLYGYTGGPLCSETAPCGKDAFGISWSSGYYSAQGFISAVESGSLTLAGTSPPSGVPEPSTATFLATGLAGVIALCLLKRA